MWFGGAYPWEMAEQVDGSVYVAGSSVLTIDLELHIPQVREHGWMRGKVMFIKHPLSKSGAIVKIDRAVLNWVLLRGGSITVLDYHHKLKKKWSHDEINELCPRATISELEVGLPVDKPEEYEPDTKYQQYVMMDDRYSKNK